MGFTTAVKIHTNINPYDARRCQSSQPDGIRALTGFPGYQKLQKQSTPIKVPERHKGSEVLCSSSPA